MEKESQHKPEFLISNKEEFDAKVARMKEGGAEKLHILTDFDRTLTRGMIDGEKTPSIISFLRSGGYLSDEYAKKAYELFDHYHPLEIDDSIPKDERVRLMDEWWMKHFELLGESGLTMNVLKQVASENPRLFREGAFHLLDAAHKAGIPVVIMSASVGDMIDLYLKEHGRDYPNVHVISNHLEYDENGQFIKVKNRLSTL